MRKLLATISAILLAASVPSQGQVWTYDATFFTGTQPHGVVVDAAGKIWITQNAQTDTLENGETASGITVLNPDGSEASFSPVTTLTIDGVPDTLAFNNRGISLDNNGNILTCSGYLYRINYQTGEGMNKYNFDNRGAVSLTEAAADQNGYIYLTMVVPNGAPIVILDEDFELFAFVEDSSFSISRTLVVTPDGKDVYLGRIYGVPNGILHYHSDLGPEGEYAAVDTLQQSIWAGQCLDWDRNGLLWAGSYWDVAEGDLTGWYALDPTQEWAIVDTVGHSFGRFATGVPPAPGSYYSPRGLAWSADGLTLYAADFDGGRVTRWINSDPKKPGSPPIFVSVKDRNPLRLPTEFTLFQNYPNPFNPSTTIPFNLKKSGVVELKVFNLMGNEVGTLVNERMQAGSYTRVFNATGLASGTYYYTLKLDGQLQTKQMLYLK